MNSEDQQTGPQAHASAPPPRALWRHGPGSGLAASIRELASGKANWIDLGEYPDDGNRLRSARAAAHAAASRESIQISTYRSTDNRLVAAMVGKREDAR